MARKKTPKNDGFLCMYIYPSHGYTVLAADEIFKKYQAILACSAVLIHVNPIWPLGHIDAEAPLGHIDAEAPLGHIEYRWKG